TGASRQLFEAALVAELDKAVDTARAHRLTERRAVDVCPDGIERPGQTEFAEAAIRFGFDEPRLVPLADGHERSEDGFVAVELPERSHDGALRLQVPHREAAE